jgi:hypothetical protein
MYVAFYNAGFECLYIVVNSKVVGLGPGVGVGSRKIPLWINFGGPRIE